jgi:hypothetical protein
MEPAGSPPICIGVAIRKADCRHARQRLSSGAWPCFTPLAYGDELEESLRSVMPFALPAIA